MYPSCPPARSNSKPEIAPLLPLLLLLLLPPPHAQPLPLLSLLLPAQVMTCPGGCIGGGGQPKTKDIDAILKRMDAIYTIDERSTIRKCHDNPAIKRVYDEFFTEPCSEKSHDLLHTHYTNR